MVRPELRALSGRTEKPTTKTSDMAVNIIIPKFGNSESIPAWVERSMRHGNFLHEMLRREKAATNFRQRQVAQRYAGYERRPGSDFNLIGVTDATTFQRWYQTDPGIIEDPSEFKKFVKQNPEMRPFRSK